MSIALALVSFGVGAAIGLALFLNAGEPQVAAGVVPERRERFVDASHDVEAARREVEAPGSSEARVPELEAAHVPGTEAEQKQKLALGGTVTLRDFEGLADITLTGLQALEVRLTADLSASTADELRRRFAQGLGAFAGSGDEFDSEAAWDRESIMCIVSPGDGTHWRVVLPREEYPDAYALWDRRAAVRAELEARRAEVARRSTPAPERNPNATGRE